MNDRFHITKESNLLLTSNNLPLIIYNSARLEGINTTYPDTKTILEGVYNSARLEGINTTYPDTKTILEGVNVPNLKLDEINCILNLRDAWNYTISNIVMLGIILYLT